MSDSPYQVLANKYRPKVFEDLIGQEVLVTTLTHAIEQNRIANAFLLTGIRGVGKTTTARIIARALNCIGEDGQKGLTTEICGVCSNCTAIDQDRHPDVIEMDAASRTGVDDIREIIDNVRYMPTTGRYKIYIIDEVHMLSKNAFNALLKTLEEPPAHVKFIFATTEIRKIPITILSRCQRFDLKRITPDIMTAHLKKIADNEGANTTTEALDLIAEVSEGSVRDALSILDQAILHTQKNVELAPLRQMVGLSDSSRTLALLENIFKGDAVNALEAFKTLYNDGADPLLLMQEVMEQCYWLTKLKVLPNLDIKKTIPVTVQDKLRELAASLSLSYLSRLWQLLSKGIGELKQASNDYIAAEMLIIRATHMSNLPSPATVIRKIEENGVTSPQPNALSQGQSAPAAGPSNYNTTPSQQTINQPGYTNGPGTPTASLASQLPQVESQQSQNIAINSFEDLVELFNKNSEILIHSWLVKDIKPIKCESGYLECYAPSSVPSSFAGDVSRHLQQWTGQRWVVVLTQENSDQVQTIEQRQQLVQANQKKHLETTGNVAKLLQLFPGATISEFKKDN